MSFLKNNDELNNEEIVKIIATSKKNKKKDLTDNLDKHNSIQLTSLNSDTLDKDVQNIESFRKYYLFQTKNFYDGNTFFGLIHIRLAFLLKIRVVMKIISSINK